MNWIKQFFCAHRYEWARNIYGDEINACGGKRSVWLCTKCGNRQDRKDFHHAPRDDGDLRGVAGPLPEHGWD
jgi:hypothetical protein